MFKEAKHTLGLMAFYMKFNLSAVMEYRVSFIVQTLGMALNNSAFIFFWWILFSNVETIGDYGFTDVMTIWALASTAFGIANIIFGNAGRITQMIMSGELDTYLLQPTDPLVNMICGRTRLSAWGDALYGLVLMALVHKGNMPVMALFLLLSVTGGLLLTAVMVTVHSLSFYAGNLQSLAGLVTEFMITFSIYPEGIFGQGIKGILYTLIPVAYIAYLPKKIITQMNLAYLPVVILGVVIWIFIAYFTFYKGLRRYESGNLIISRL